MAGASWVILNSLHFLPLFLLPAIACMLCGKAILSQALSYTTFLLARIVNIIFPCLRGTRKCHMTNCFFGHSVPEIDPRGQPQSRPVVITTSVRP